MAQGRTARCRIGEIWLSSRPSSRWRPWWPNSPYYNWHIFGGDAAIKHFLAGGHANPTVHGLATFNRLFKQVPDCNQGRRSGCIRTGRRAPSLDSSSPHREPPQPPSNNPRPHLLPSPSSLSTARRFLPSHTSYHTRHPWTSTECSPSSTPPSLRLPYPTSCLASPRRSTRWKATSTSERTSPPSNRLVNLPRLGTPTFHGVAAHR